MRVIAGKARHLPLKTAPGMDTRPTTDRIKETLFNMINLKLPGRRFLDLFAGSGGIGLEAASRGAKEVVFVELNRRAADCIRENICFTRLEQESRLLCMDVFAALRQLEQEQAESFDFIFMDPPYQKGWEQRVLEYLKDSSLVSRDTVLIAEAARDTDFSYLDALGYEIEKIKNYKTNVHVFLKRAEGRLP